MKSLLNFVLIVSILFGTAGSALAFVPSRLEIALASSPVSDTITGGESSVNLGAFSFSNSGDNDLIITRIKINGLLDEDLDGNYNDTATGAVKSDNGMYISDIISSVWLVDETGALVGTSTVFGTNGDALFMSLALSITSEETKLINVYGNISSSAPYNGTDDLIAVNILRGASLVVARTTTGRIVPVVGRDVNGPEDSPTVYMTITDGSGTLSIAEDTIAPVDSQIAEQEDTDLLVARYILTATDEDWELGIITFTPTDSSNTIGSSSTRADNIQSLTLLYPTDLSDPFTLDGSSTVAMSGTNVTFSGLSAMIPVDSSITIELYADLTAHALDGGSLDSDDGFNMTINTGDKDCNTNGNLEAVGLSSSVTKTESDYSDVTASNTTYVYRTIPTVANSTSLSSSLITGPNQEIYRFTVTSGIEDMILGYISLDVTSTGLVTGATANSLTNNIYGLYENPWWTSGYCAGTTTYSTAPWYVVDNSTGNVVGTGCYDSYNQVAKIEMFVNNSDYSSGVTSGVTIASGSTKTFKVYADIFEDSDASTTSSISTKIHEDTMHIPTTTFNAIRTNSETYYGTTTGMIWSDNGSPTGLHGLTMSEWIVGYKVPGMPVSYMILSI